MRSVLIGLLIAASTPLALAQSWTATTGTTQPMKTAPSSNSQGIREPKSKIPPPANSTTRGIHVGDDALDAGPIGVKRNK